jgi:hypothetical protein
MAESLICSIDGTKMMDYQDFKHYMDNLLNSPEIWRILHYDCNLVFIYRKGLFENPSFLAFQDLWNFFDDSARFTRTATGYSQFLHVVEGHVYAFFG